MKEFYINLANTTEEQKQILVDKLNIVSWYDDWSIKLLSYKKAPYLIYLGDSIKRYDKITKGFLISQKPEKKEISFSEFMELPEEYFVKIKSN